MSATLPPTSAPLPPAAQADPRLQAFLDRIAAEPGRFDFYQALRRFEALHPELPRLGEAVRPTEEPLRIGQPADLGFAPSPIKALELRGEHPRLLQRIFGFVGPNGPLPIHLTELTRERALHHGDQTLQRFLDFLTHRFALLFYRAWAQAQPALGLDRGDDSGFGPRLGGLFGIGIEGLSQRDTVGDAAKLHFTGRLARHVRDADGLLNWCRSEFDVPVDIQQWRGHWMTLGRDERTRLRLRHNGDIAQSLGRGAVLGGSVWDVQHKFRIVIGPLRESRYHAFLPGGSDLARLQAMVRQWVGLEFEWDLQIILARADVPRLSLGRSGELGRSTWLGHFRRERDADDLVIDVERTLTEARRRRRKAGAAPSPTESFAESSGEAIHE
ncbi:type VI secretion system baseplate subunit TssG [Xylophilus rhododendri]|uniref:Type VI secretion system baseplate subunit TssG n=1 Tax=Xylophilus rhododendri TaxID=2697032 RepID=A0A857JCZ7_9BURK|nr:type VI secretion system baseplate subunit TssG [Xylophilus rhododendri]QHJ00980.1 type VI secretion system baseplate subunit TssG [Xylophilus rhododendri]